jgi:type 1 fimbriae regulatory protein FimB/type 1 fimbriae regulatory protein FimE
MSIRHRIGDDRDIIDEYGKKLSARQSIPKGPFLPFAPHDPESGPRPTIAGQAPLPFERPSVQQAVADLVAGSRADSVFRAVHQMVEGSPAALLAMADEVIAAARPDESRKPPGKPAEKPPSKPRGKAKPAALPGVRKPKSGKPYKPAIPATQNRPPTRAQGVPHNATVRAREHLEEREVFRLIDSAGMVGKTIKDGRPSPNGERNSMMLFMAFRHGLRVSELTSLSLEQVLWDSSELYVKRVKGGVPSTHTLTPKEMKYLKKLGRKTGLIFLNTHCERLSNSSVDKMIALAGKRAGFTFRVHAHMLRHSCGYCLANNNTGLLQIQAWLGHSNIQHTIGYTKLSTTALRGVKIGE